MVIKKTINTLIVGFTATTVVAGVAMVINHEVALATIKRDVRNLDKKEDRLYKKLNKLELNQYQILNALGVKKK